MPIPPRVDRQRAGHVALAARRERAEAKSAVANEQLSPIALLHAASTNGTLGRLRCDEFLRSIPGIGHKKAIRILEHLGLSAGKRLGGLGSRQRTRLVEFLQTWMSDHPPKHAALIVLAGPTAVGKGTVASAIKAQFPHIDVSVSVTTRSPRPGEVHGESYFFVTDEEFDEMIRSGHLLEWATVHNAYRYGTPREPVERALAEGRSMLLEIDIQGARSVRSAMPSAHLVFLLPPSFDELVRRLVGRGTESPEEQRRRLETARVELAAVGEFDRFVINDDVHKAAQKVVGLQNAQRGSRPRARP